MQFDSLAQLNRTYRDFHRPTVPYAIGGMGRAVLALLEKEAATAPDVAEALRLKDKARETKGGLTLFADGAIRDSLGASISTRPQ